MFDDGKQTGLSVRAQGARDATPADLERGGWVRDGDLLALTVRAEKAERELSTERDEHDSTLKTRDSFHAMLAEAKEFAAHERARQQPARRCTLCHATRNPDGVCSMLGCKDPLHDNRAEREPKDRATDEELVGVMRAAVMAVPCLPPAQWEVWLDARDKAGVRAVAARVRQERCLVAQAVAANVDIRVAEDDRGGFMVGVHAPMRDEGLERAVLSSDVPATLARLLGEVSR